MINLRVLAVAIQVALGMLGAVQVADPASLGIDPVAMRWLVILGIGLGILAGFLPKVQGPTTDPRELIERISKLPEEDRLTIASTLADRAQGRARS